MKKIIGILSVTTLAMVMFFNTNAMNKIGSDFNLSSLIILNTANAEVIHTDPDGNETIICENSTTNCTYKIEGVTVTVSNQSNPTQPDPFDPNPNYA